MSVPYIFATALGGSGLPLGWIDADFAYITDGNPTFKNLTLSGNLTVGGTTALNGPVEFNNNTITLYNGLNFQTANPTGFTGTGLWVLNNTPVLISPILGTPTSGNLANCNNLPISTGVSGLGTGIATFLGAPSSANLLAAMTNETGTGQLVFNTNPTINSPTLTAPVLGTPASGNLTNCTGFPATNLAGIVPIANGGTGLSTTGTLGQILGVTAANTLGYFTAPPAASVAGGLASTVLYQSAPNVTSFIPNGVAGQPLVSNGTNAPQWQQIDLTAAVTNVLPVSNGGTGRSSLGAGVQTSLGTAVDTPGGFATFPAGSFPAGAVVYFAMQTAPAGWLFCNGASVSTTTYASLFAAIGYTYGGAGGNFNLPNLNGQFIRSWDSAGSVDPGRVFGSTQNDAYENHTHGVTDPGHFHNTPPGVTGVLYANGPGGNPTYYAGGSGSNTNAIGNVITDTKTTGVTVNTSTTGGNETRPVNVALYACIKF
jgi:microcystin-dependent protein